VKKGVEGHHPSAPLTGWVLNSTTEGIGISDDGGDIKIDGKEMEMEEFQYVPPGPVTATSDEVSSVAVSLVQEVIPDVSPESLEESSVSFSASSSSEDESDEDLLGFLLDGGLIWNEDTGT